jgi:hypothetical protein
MSELVGLVFVMFVLEYLNSSARVCNVCTKMSELVVLVFVMFVLECLN